MERCENAGRARNHYAVCVCVYVRVVRRNLHYCLITKHSYNLAVIHRWMIHDFLVCGTWPTFGLLFVRSCHAGYVAVYDPNNVPDTYACLEQNLPRGQVGNTAGTKSLTLDCEYGQVISSVEFASLGNSYGSCQGGFLAGSCYVDATTIIRDICINQESCVLGSSLFTIIKRNTNSSACSTLPFLEWELTARAICTMQQTTATSTTATTQTTDTTTTSVTATSDTTTTTGTTSSTTTYIPSACGQSMEPAICGGRILPSDCSLSTAIGESARKTCPVMCDTCSSTTTTVTSTSTRTTTSTTTNN